MREIETYRECYLVYETLQKEGVILTPLSFGNKDKAQEYIENYTLRNVEMSLVKVILPTKKIVADNEEQVEIERLEIN